MGRMRYPDGRLVPPEVEAQVWGKVAADVDRSLIARLPVSVTAWLAGLDEETIQRVWPIVRAAWLGAITPEQAEEQLRALKAPSPGEQPGSPSTDGTRGGGPGTS